MSETGKLETGRKVGKYEIIRPLGAGKEGCVYLVIDSALSRLAALKQIGEGAGAEGTQPVGGEVIPEAVFLRDLRHSMLPVVYDLLYEDGWYLVMEYIEGISLHNYIEKKGPVGEAQGIAWAEELLSILEYLHNRKPPVIYRDLKPENMIVCPDRHLRLVDLGAACLKSYGQGADKRMALTPGYGAPEQQAGTGQPVYADERSDIYAFGRILHYMLTGADPAKPPYGELPASAYNPLLGDDIDQVIQKCTRKEPGERYQVVEEIRRDLSGQGCCQRGCRQKSFLRHMEKRIWLTQKKTAGLS